MAEIITYVQSKSSAQPPFSPTDIAGLQLWLKADAGVTLNGSTVSAWADQSGNGNNVLQSNAACQPTFIIDSLNGYPVLSFDGSNDYLDGGDILDFGDNPWTFFAVYTHRSNGSIVFAKSLYGAANNRYYFGSLGNTQFFNINKSGLSANLTAIDIPWNRYAIVSLWSPDSVNYVLYIDGINSATGAIYTGLESTYNFLIGAYNNSSGSVPPESALHLNGCIAEIIMFNRILTSTEKNDVNNYLKMKYGL